MNNDSKKSPSRFPQEMPADKNKEYGHGVIESVVRNEIDIKPAVNPSKPHNTDSLNTEFAKQEQNKNM